MQSKSALLNAQHRTRKAILSAGYWTGVLVVGFGITGIILHFSGIPLVNSAAAGIGNYIILFFGNLLYFAFIVPVSIFAFLITLLLEIVIQYPYGLFWKDSTAGGFVNIGAVVKGWRLVRDICNMFFALILVIIALATVLKIEAYDWKRMLPKLILNAVLINFSKSIAGVFTDFATVAMATFGGSFTSTMGKAMLTGFGMSSDLLGVSEVDENDTERTDPGTLLVAFVAAAIMLILFTIIALVFLVTLIFRIVMLWFLIVLSPLAYITRILPQTEKYSHQWWEMFGRFVVVGPLVTFFLWLSLTIAFDETQKASPFSTSELDTQFGNTEEWTSRGVSKPPETLGTATQPNRLASFMIGILMLMASLKLINQMAAEAGSITGKVESAAMGAGLRLFQKSGQFLSRRKWGKGPPAIGEEDTRTWGERLAYNAGNAAVLLGGSVLQPVTWFKGMVHAIEEQSDANQQKARGEAMIRLGEMRAEAILGRGFGGGILGTLNNMGGILGGAGMEDGAHIFEKYVSGEGVKRIYNRAKLWKKFGVSLLDLVDTGEVDKDGKPIKVLRYKLEVMKAEKEEEEIKKRYTQDELVKTAPAYNEVVTAINKIGGELNAVKSNLEVTKLDASMPFIAAALEEQIKQLENDRGVALLSGNASIAKKRKAQIDLLQNAIEKGEELTLGDLLNDYAGNDGKDALKQRVSSEMQRHIDELTKEEQEIKERLDATGVSGYNTDGTLGVLDSSSGKLNVTGLTGSKLTDDKERNDAKKHTKSVKHKVDHMLSELGAVEAGMSYEARKYKQKLVGEEMEKLRDVKNTDELMVYFNAAIDEKNHHMIEALLKRITHNGDENEIFQEWLSSLMHDPQVARVMKETGLQPSSGRSGVELFRKAILQGKMGMTTNDSIRLMNDAVCYDAEEGRHHGPARLYGTVAGQWTIRSLKEQQDTLSTENRKKDINDIIKGNRLIWGDEHGAERELRISDAGWDGLLTRGEALGATRVWERMDANAKLRLSDPKMTRQMRAKKINSELIKKLENYWITTGQYVEQESWQTAMGIRKFMA